MMACQAARCGATWIVFALAIIALPIIRKGYGLVSTLKDY